MASTTLTHEGMTYHIIDTGDGYDVRDVAGNRPLALRAEGPWDTAQEAEEAVRRLAPSEAAL